MNFVNHLPTIHFQGRKAVSFGLSPQKKTSTDQAELHRSWAAENLGIRLINGLTMVKWLWAFWEFWELPWKLTWRTLDLMNFRNQRDNTPNGEQNGCSSYLLLAEWSSAMFSVQLPFSSKPHKDTKLNYCRIRLPSSTIFMHSSMNTLRS